MMLRGLCNSLLPNLVLAAAMIPIAANAQQVGTYAGQTTDGHPVTIHVSFYPSTGQYYVDQLLSGFSVKCPRTGTSRETMLGVNGAIMITDGSGQAEYLLTNMYLGATITFSGTANVSGKVQGALATFVGTDAPPRAAESCKSSNLAFSAAYSPPALGLLGQSLAASESFSVDIAGTPVQHSIFRIDVPH